jgi:hypothetical protein
MSHEPADGVRSQPAKTQRATLMAEFRSKSWTTDALALIAIRRRSARIGLETRRAWHSGGMRRCKRMLYETATA